MGESFTQPDSSTQPDDYRKFKALLVGSIATTGLAVWLIFWDLLLGADVPGFDVGLLVISLWILFIVVVARRQINFDEVLE